ncbi:diacylglycerol/lipid kinase family protein [Halocola ammonii]
MMQEKKFLFVINPISGGVDKSLLPQKIEIFSKRYSLQTEIIKTTGENDPERIEELIESFAPDTLVACGGDGTVNMVAQIAFKRNCELGLIPGGSANGMATELGIPDDFDEALDFLVESKTIACDLLRVNDHLCIHLADVGLNAALIERFEKSNQRGWWGYAREFVQQWKERYEVRYQVKTDGESKERKIKGLVAIIANATVFGTGACVNPNGKINDGVFEIIVFKPQGIFGFLGTTLRSFFGKLSNSPFAKTISAKSAQLTLSKEQPLQVDGEFICKTRRVDISVEESALKIIGSNRYQNGLQIFD